MIVAGLAAVLLLSLSGGGQDKQARPPQGRPLTFQQQIIVRVPQGPVPGAPNASMIRWEEHGGPRCVAWAQIAAAALVRQDSVDLIFRDSTRIRARLERRCPALDFYRGFYLGMTPDGLICADRDSIRSRTGGECEIERFRTLRARRP